MIKKILCICLVILLCVFLFNCINNFFEQHNEYRYSLFELDDGVYGVYTNVVSNVPAHNYEMITICCNGQFRTYKGNVVITYTDAEPYVIVQDYYNIVNNEQVYLYVPYGSIQFQNNVNAS